MLGFLRQIDHKLVQYNDDDLQTMYLDYFNNYLTREKYAEHNNFTMLEANAVLDRGQAIHDQRNS